MTVERLDHVNIVADDLMGTAQFYAELLDLDIRLAPPPLTPENARWAYDRNGQAVIHINSVDCPRRFDREIVSGPTGSIHHIAFRCQGFDAVEAKLKARGAQYSASEVKANGLRQLFTLDPNGVLLELNFFSG
ncbi:glyoxalase/bleomycin resistance protein/dioxygenase superfamily protein [Blastomonas natatoria]|uniref:Glyoxalase/bleomycin resistance protein/dioxygenase superfamily protein n=1 Tax=Blastomonas natatoria TaxID=34015 RepID=A0A2V3V8K6_9SPHN|nr:VOC family protein [Blastomonas natatoria]PXW77900.1 glyoxalase/bleomycin resistance protein/dioxygenase superfamily protein [Blastomonas natatoria]